MYYIMKLTRKTDGVIRFTSTADPHELEQKLGRIEDEARHYLDAICQQCCKKNEAGDKREILGKCSLWKDCPVTSLADLIGV